MKNARPDNPYKDALETYFGDDEPMLLNPPQTVYVPSQTDTYHLVTDYDTLDTLAFDKYGNSKLFHIIAHANNLIDPFAFYAQRLTPEELFTSTLVSLAQRGFIVNNPECLENYLTSLIGEDDLPEPTNSGITLRIPNLAEYQLKY